MNIIAKTTVAETHKTDCLIVGINENGKPGTIASHLNKLTKGHIGKIIKRSGFDGNAGQVMMVMDVDGITAPHVLLVGCGNPKSLSETGFRKIIMAMAHYLNTYKIKDATCYLTETVVNKRDVAWKARQIAEVTAHAQYRFEQLKTEKNNTPATLSKLTIHATNSKESKAVSKAVKNGSAIANGMALARDLGNLPGNVCTPTYLANQAKKLGKAYEMKVTVLGQKEMERLKMGSLLSVAKGSRQPPKFIVIEHQGAKKPGNPIVLVGKGITFDAGGISIKPSAAMDEMKFDMCGAASVLGTFKAVGELKLPVNVIGVIPTCENLPDGNANKPGDIVKSMSGQTIEILNTDAEGRLILCDALTYTEKFKPKAVIDIATLTGACIIALGHQASAIIGNDDKLIGTLLKAGDDSMDRVWQLPMWDEYQEQLKSNFADMANIGGRAAGTITAACFLARFTKKFKWAHLDIAGTAWNSGELKGATGRPVPLLTEYLLTQTTKG